MNRRANPGGDSDIAKIAAVRAAWIRAVEASDVGGLIALATDDIVVVHGEVVSGVKGGSGVQTHSRIVAVFSRQPDASSKVARVIALPG